jgi:hypothetical protein
MTVRRRELVTAVDALASGRVYDPWSGSWLRAPKPARAARPLCGARCRSKGGAPCLARVCVRMTPDGAWLLATRCRLHGGLSTGPRTAAGRAACVEAGRRGAATRWRRGRVVEDAP